MQNWAGWRAVEEGGMTGCRKGLAHVNVQHVGLP